MKIWFDLCEPKAPIYLRPLFEKVKDKYEVLITARNFDATYDLLDNWGVSYEKVGEHGGKDLPDKLHSYIDRMHDLLAIVEDEQPDFLFSMAAPEAIRISYGLGIPNIMFYDEPRSVGCSKLTLPMTTFAVVSKYIPFEWYSIYGITQERVLPFNGIDEIGWLNSQWFEPDEKYLTEYSLEMFNYIVCRPEATQSYSHKKDWLKSEDSLLSNTLPDIISYLKKKNRSAKILLIARYQEQYYHFLQKFEEEIRNKRIILRTSVNHLADLMYYSSLVLSGGGTMVRESSLLGVPSVEFIPSETYPQEEFLIKNGFPLVHVTSKEAVFNETIKILENGQNSVSQREKIRARIDEFENPIEVGYSKFLELI